MTRAGIAARRQDMRRLRTTHSGGKLRAYLDDRPVRHDVVSIPVEQVQPQAPLGHDGDDGLVSNWHVVKAVTGKEQQVAAALAQGGIATFCPMQLLTTHSRGKLHQKEKALFRNYLFAKWQTADPYRWHEVMDTTGVLGIIGDGEPQTLEPEIVEAWIARVGIGDILADAHLLKTMGDLQRGYRIGDYVTSEGAYVGQDLLVLDINEENQTVRLQISLLGRIVVIQRQIKECEFAYASEPPLDAPPPNRGGARRSRRGGRQSFLVRSYRKRRRQRK